MTTGCVVPKIGLTASNTSRPSAANSGPRWSMVGAAMARNTRSGTFVGPGICRKWRPVVVVTDMPSASRQAASGATPEVHHAGDYYRQVDILGASSDLV